MNATYELHVDLTMYDRMQKAVAEAEAKDEDQGLAAWLCTGLPHLPPGSRCSISLTLDDRPGDVMGQAEMVRVVQVKTE